MYRNVFLRLVTCGIKLRSLVAHYNVLVCWKEYMFTTCASASAWWRHLIQIAELIVPQMALTEAQDVIVHFNQKCHD